MSFDMKSSFFFLSLLIVPLGAAAQESAPASTAPEVRPCTVTMPGTDVVGWREVQATGFTFCVPANWRPVGRARNGVDARVWRGGGGEVKWGSGSPRTVATVTTVVSGPVSAIPRPTGQVHRLSEVIGGKRADLWDNEFEGSYYTGAEWSAPAVYVAGESRDRATSRLQLQVVRTVRFAQP
ncbi:MAG TPA: hypothetical protein VGB92_18505 [Longimicrobium sp.]|jgi:hypothetical protein